MWCLLQEVTNMFENLQSQLTSLRLLVLSADPKTGRPNSNGSPTRVRSKSVAVVPDVAVPEPSPLLRQAERLFDLWQECMEEDSSQLREAVRAVSQTVDTVCFTFYSCPLSQQIFVHASPSQPLIRSVGCPKA